MAKLTAYGAREIARWVKTGGETLVLMQLPSGKTRFMRKSFSGDTYHEAPIVVGRKANGGPIYSERPTLEQAEEFALRNGFERKRR